MDNQYEIDEILDFKIYRGKIKYLVQWKGYPYEEASWVPKDNINATRFHKKYPHKPGGGGVSTVGDVNILSCCSQVGSW